MRLYQYKIQWLFSVEKEAKEMNTVLKIIGARSLSKIVFRDQDLKIIREYTTMFSYHSITATREAIKDIKYFIKRDPTIKFVEFFKR